MIRLNLGSGDSDKAIPGYENLDRKHGQEIYPLKREGVDEIHASHVLEHFPHRQLAAVLLDWVKALKPGGVLKVAVPDFDRIVSWYQACRTDKDIQGYLMGGQTDADDFHKTVFNDATLRDWLTKAGLEDIKPWQSEIDDCAAKEVSLNLQGTKPLEPRPDEAIRIHAVSSVPRLGFNATWHCTITALNALGIPLTMVEGVYWGQCLTRGIEKVLREGADYIVTIDYDSIFTAAQLHRLCQLIVENSEYDVIVPVQVKRETGEALFRHNGSRDFSGALTPISTGHFGLTIFRAHAFSRIPTPWFFGQPNDKGEWNDGRIDDDMWFWRQVKQARLKVGLSNEVRIGHLEMVITWPGDDYTPVHQSVTDYRDNGQPGGSLKVHLTNDTELGL